MTTRQLFLTVLFALAFSVAAPRLSVAGQAQTTETPQQGFTSIFDGKTLNGWKVYGKQADLDKGYWKVEDGAITCNTLKKN